MVASQFIGVRPLPSTCGPHLDPKERRRALPCLRLTDRQLRAFSAEERVELWDETVAGLLVRVSTGGSKVFFVRYRAKEEDLARLQTRAGGEQAKTL